MNSNNNYNLRRVIGTLLIGGGLLSFGLGLNNNYRDTESVKDCLDLMREGNVLKANCQFLKENSDTSLTYWNERISFADSLRVVNNNKISELKSHPDYRNYRQGQTNGVGAGSLLVGIGAILFRRKRELSDSIED